MVVQRITREEGTSGNTADECIDVSIDINSKIEMAERATNEQTAATLAPSIIAATLIIIIIDKVRDLTF